MNFFTRCSKSGRLYLKSNKDIKFYLLPLWGLLALIWIAIRVIPKPSRASYPCMKVAMPLASGFIAFVAGIFISAWLFIKSHKYFKKANYWVASLLFAAGLGLTILLQGSNQDASAHIKTFTPPVHGVMGEAKGIFPGRVVWVHDADATNENTATTGDTDAWFLPKNADQNVVDKMLSNGLKQLTGQTSDSTAWKEVFKYYNKNKGKGEVGYKDGEIIFIKTNATSSWGGNFSTKDLSKSKNGSYQISETSPHVLMAVLRQLVNVAGVPQKNIYLGDPMKHVYKHIYDYLHAEFPNVHYIDHDGYTELGREKAEFGTKDPIIFADKGTILRDGPMYPNSKLGDYIKQLDVYKLFEDCDYLINIPQMKGHKRAGMTMFAKNHFGSHTWGNASPLHNGLPAPVEMQNADFSSRFGYGLYRVQVDLMGHKDLGGKNLIYIMDALWSTDQELGNPKKFFMAPFNNDFTSSIFLSQDPVAIESVGYDVLRTEFTEERDNTDGALPYVQMDGVEDYLHQAADSTTWPAGVKYAPNGDGIAMSSQGVHEHWDNSTDRKYSKNLGTGNGIELVEIDKVTGVAENNYHENLSYNLLPNYPNPFNPATTITYEIPQYSHVDLSVYDIQGRKVATIVNGYNKAGWYSVKFDGRNLSSGVYIYQLTAGNFKAAKKFTLMK